jgi:hypothetical protein
MTTETFTEGRAIDLRAGASGKLTSEERLEDIVLFDRYIVEMTLPEYRDEIDQWVKARCERFAFELLLAHDVKGAPASAAQLQEAMRIGGRIAAERAAKAGAAAGYQRGVVDGRTAAEAEAAKRRPAASTLAVERDEKGRPVSITETAADGTVTVKHVEHDASGRIVRLVAVTE